MIEYLASEFSAENFHIPAWLVWWKTQGGEEGVWKKEQSLNEKSLLNRSFSPSFLQQTHSIENTHKARGCGLIEFLLHSILCSSWDEGGFFSSILENPSIHWKKKLFNFNLNNIRISHWDSLSNLLNSPFVQMLKALIKPVKLRERVDKTIRLLSLSPPAPITRTLDFYYLCPNCICSSRFRNIQPDEACAFGFQSILTLS